MRKIDVKKLLVLPLLLGALALGACGGGSADDGSGSNDGAGPAPTAGGGTLSSLSDEDVACLEGQGVTVPERPEGEPPEGMPEGGPPEGERPEGMPEGMEGLRAAMSKCGIEMLDPPGGDGPPDAESAS